MKQPRDVSKDVALTARENEVMSHLAKCLLYKEIADNMGIAISTVNQHLNHVYRKLGAANKVEALIRCPSTHAKNGQDTTANKPAIQT